MMKYFSWFSLGAFLLTKLDQTPIRHVPNQFNGYPLPLIPCLAARASTHLPSAGSGSDLPWVLGLRVDSCF